MENESEVCMENKIVIRILDSNNSKDINLPNQPFSLFGRLIPIYMNEEWGYQVHRFDESQTTEMCFPDENYDFVELSKNSIVLGAYLDDKCIGIAILQHSWNKYMYLYDLKVNTDYRGKHIGTLLIEKAKEVSKENNYNGIYTQGQDNNLGACLFYLRNGFKIGGLDTNVYKGTKQEGKADVIFYLDSEKTPAI